MAVNPESIATWGLLGGTGSIASWGFLGEEKEEGQDMVDTITSQAIVEIVPNAGGMSNFDMKKYRPAGHGVYLAGVNFKGSATGDILKVRDRSGTGPFLVSELVSGDSMKFEPPILCVPYILASEQTQGTPANCIITFYLA